MMTIEEFAAMALSFPETAQGIHMGTTDFRVGGKIFATIRPEKGRGVLQLSPGDQAMACETGGNVFEPVPGGWGAKGSTFVILEKAEPDTVRHVMAMAWRKAAPKSISAQHTL